MDEKLKEKVDSLDAFEKLYLSRYLLHSFIQQTEKDYEEHLKKQNKNAR